MRRRALEFAGSPSGADGGDHDQQCSDDAKGRKRPVLDFNPAKQRRTTDQKGREQKHSRSRKQPDGNSVGRDGTRRLLCPIAQVRPHRQFDLVQFERQPSAQQAARWREHQ